MNEVNKNIVVLGLGSNLGNRYAYLLDALAQLEDAFATKAVRSSIVESMPWGDKHQARFLNMVAFLWSDSPLEEVFRTTQKIEEELGKKVVRKWGPRCIDIDVLFFGDEVVKREGIHVPHPYLHERDFVIHPLAEILPAFTHPVLEETLSEISLNTENKTLVFST